MNNLMIFEGRQVEVFEFDGKVLFNPKHVAECLEIADVNSSTRKFNEKQIVKLNNSDMHDMHIRKLNNAGENFLTESGVYKLIFKSHKPDAEKFQDWVTDEVLPAIRKTGSYNQAPHGKELLALAVLEAQETIENQERQIKELIPKAVFADSVAASTTTILIGELAKILKQNGVATGQNRLFEWMRQNGYLINRKGTDYSMPTQRSMEMGLFEIKETSVSHSDGHITVSKTPKVTGKGQIYFINKLKPAVVLVAE